MNPNQPDQQEQARLLVPQTPPVDLKEEIEVLRRRIAHIEDSLDMFYKHTHDASGKAVIPLGETRHMLFCLHG